VNGDGELQGPIASLAASYGRDSNPSVAADEEGYGVAWVSEMGQADLNFQRLSADGALVGEPAAIAQSHDMTLAPRILPGPGGFDLFWAQDSWGEEDGLYHAELTSEGAVVGPVAHVSWMVPEYGQMDVVSHRDRFAVAWSSKVYDLQGLFWAEFPLSQSPVWLLSEEGAEVAMQDTGLGFAVVWRQSGQGAGGSYSTLHLQSFDQDGESLNDPVQLVHHVPLAYRPRISYLGGVFLLTWMEQDGYGDDEPGRIQSLQLTEDGSRLGQPEELIAASPPPADLFQVRFDDFVLVGYVEPGESEDTLHFVRFRCVP